MTPCRTEIDALWVEPFSATDHQGPAAPMKMVIHADADDMAIKASRRRGKVGPTARGSERGARIGISNPVHAGAYSPQIVIEVIELGAPPGPEHPLQTAARRPSVTHRHKGCPAERRSVNSGRIDRRKRNVQIGLSISKTARGVGEQGWRHEIADARAQRAEVLQAFLRRRDRKRRRAAGWIVASAHAAPEPYIVVPWKSASAPMTKSPN